MIADRRDPGRSARRRRGFGLIEMAISTLLLAAAMVATAQVIGWVALEGRAVARRERAVREAANLMERLASRGWDDLSPDSLSNLRLSGPTAAALPGSALDVRVATIEDAPARKRVTVEIRWNDRSGRPEATVRLVAWSYRRGGESR